jgi:hypothetical protein
MAVSSCQISSPAQKAHHAQGNFVGPIFSFTVGNDDVLQLLFRVAILKLIIKRIE